MSRFFIFLISLSFFYFSSAQERCSTDEYLDILYSQFPEYKNEREKVNLETKKWIESNYIQNSKSIITIPVVVHVVWNTNTENISCFGPNTRTN